MTLAASTGTVAPSTAEEMWEQLGHQPSVAQASWPEVDPALLEQDAVTAVVQIQGKVRARLEVSPEISEADLEAAALADETVLAGDRRPRGATRHRARAQAGQHRRVTPPGRWVNPPIASGEQLGLLADVGCGTPYLASTA